MSSSGGEVVIGLPPINTYYTNYIDEKELAKKTRPYVDIFPKEPKRIDPVKAYKIFELRKASGPTLRVYFDPNTSFTESFQNIITDHFLSSIIRPAEKAIQLVQSLGGEKGVADLINKIEKSSLIGSTIIGGLKTIGGMLPQRVTNLLQDIAYGYKYDFPKVWQDSSFNMQHTINTTLYCDNPDDDGAYQKSIVRPIQLLLKYVLPRVTSTSHDKYEWPYFCEAKAPGVFHLPEAIITDITIEKGAHNSLSYVGRPSIVDVRITFTPIHTVMVQGKGADFSYTLDKYVSDLKSKKQINKRHAGGGGLSRSSPQSYSPPRRYVSSADKQTMQNLIQV